MLEKLPTGWVKTTLGEVCAMNPRMPFDEFVFDDTEVSFVPMAAVEAESGRLDATKIRTLGSVRTGYTPFRENDVIFAKITPCMENGKIALATGLKNGLAFGSTEFFVFRPYEGVLPRFILYFLLQPKLREDAERQMTGASGQKRVPANYLITHEFWLPPTCEQRRIVAKLDASFSKLERAETAAHRAQERLTNYRTTVLQAAVTGELTRQWRKNHKPDENGQQFLQRLLKARRTYWEKLQFQRLSDEGKSSKNDKWKSAYTEILQANTIGLSKAPRGWTWASLDQVLSELRNGISQPPREIAGLPILRISAVRPMHVDLKNCRYLPASTTEMYKQYALKVNDLLFTRYNGSRDLAGVCARVPTITETIVHPDKLIRGTPALVDKYFSSFLAIAVNVGLSRKYIEEHLYTTAGQWRISGRNLRSTPIPLPSLAEQTQIVNEVEQRLSAADRLADTLSRQLDQTKVTRQLLLREAFAGLLVRQNPNDKPASVLLESARISREAEAKKPKGKRMSKSKSKTSRRSFLDVLRVHKKPMTPEALFRESGFEVMFNESDEPQDVVDAFYKELGMLTDKPTKVLEQKDAKHQVTLKVAP